MIFLLTKIMRLCSTNDVLHNVCMTTQGGSGYARNIKFENIVMRNVTNPIIVDQNYCDQEKPCKEKVSF